MGVLVPVVFIALRENRKWPDFVGAIPLAVSVILLLLTVPWLKKMAFAPATVVGALLFFYLTRRTRKSINAGGT
jgi:peptidoglycan biosynthesis protein MviN/MurJ (putative lipid II flippase)